MSLEAAILGFLGERPRSGYDLKTRCFDIDAQDFWTADQAQIYRTLDRLQRAKLVSVTRKRQSGKPDRKIYSLTDLGRQALASWLGSPASLPAPRDAFLLQLYFGARTTDAELAEHLRTRRALHQSRLDGLRSHAEMAAQDQSATTRQTSLRDTAYGGAVAVECAAIDWLDDCIEELDSGQLLPPLAHDERQPLVDPSTA